MVAINALAGKVADFFSDIEEINAHYIATPRKLLLKKAMVINGYFFLLYFVSLNIYIALLLLPVYIFFFYLFYLFTKICGKYRYKKAVLFPLFIVFNLFSITAAFYLRSLIGDIIGL